ncbi:M20 family metallo-hydrolase, partial [bacterium]|nr:M20 family metallo-hydrolase [bacterium]
VEDNQQGLVGSLFAVKALRDLDIIPEYNIGLTLVADEETGSEKGLDYLMQEAKDHFSKNDLIIIPDAGEADASMIEVAEKSISWMEFHVAGKQCHGSTPEAGINAHKAGAHLIVKLDSLYQIFDTVDPVFSPPISTFEPTKKEANVPNINTIPGEDIFCFDCRILPSYPLADIDKAVREISDEVELDFNVKVTVNSAQKEEAAPATPIDAPVVGVLKTAIKKVYQVDANTVGIGGGTVAAFFRRAGFNAAVWSTLEDMCHQPNEYCVISNMVNDAKVFGHIFLQE